MITDQAAPADEILSTSERSRVVRRFGATGSVIWKEAFEPGAAKRVRHESAMLQRLASVPGVAKLSRAPAAPGGITLEDDRGESLAAFLRSGERLALPALMELAIGLTETLAAVHRAGIVHRDVNPSNILLVGVERRPVLIDFDIASSFAEERPAFATRAEIEGTLAYIAPEQTGRTGRVMDQRADLYALGATFYELATGRTPFGSDDSFDVVRDHLVRVAVAPQVLDPTVPHDFSAIVMRLLEKEPDRRYQSAEGLAADLRSLRERRARGEHRAFALATSDFPQRLLPPSRLIGRESEIATLRAAFDDALAGNGCALFVAGAPGVGKTALIGELRSIATTSGGYFVSGKFDRYRQDVASDAVVRAIRSLFRLMLAEPETELVPLRARLAETLGRYAPSLVAITPELGVLLDIAPDDVEASPADEARLAQNAFDQIRCIASPTRPVVFVLDDLQWAPSAALRLVDVILSSPRVPGLLFVGAYRAEEVDASHVLAATIARAKRHLVPPRTLALGALAESDVSELLAEMLRLTPTRASALARALGSRTGGNPYDTVELVNGLRRDGLLTPGAAGWRWDDATIGRYVGEGDVVSRLTARIDALPARTGELLEIMACLGGDASSSLLQAASGTPAGALDECAGPALEDGLAVFDRGTATFRFRHDRIQQAAYARCAAHRDERHLALARRLATIPARADIAAEQYLAAVGSLADVAECHTAIALFRGAATRARTLANYALTERFLTAARELARRPALYDADVAAALDVDMHATLYLLGRLEDADTVYATIAPDAVDATCVQISSLTNRNRPADAVALGLAALGRLGLSAPARSELDAHVDARLGEIEAWGRGDDAVACDVAPPDDEEARVAAAAKIIVRMMPPAFFSDGTVMSWLVLESIALWNLHGPRATLVVPIAHAAQTTVERRADYRTAYFVGRRILETAERREYEPEASAARFLGALSAHCWFEPLETCVALAHAAHHGLVRGGDLQNACFAYYASIVLVFQACQTLDVFAAEADAGIAFARRTGNHQSVPTFLAYRHLQLALRGEPDGTEQSGAAPGALASLEGNPLGALHHHVARAQLAVFFNDFDELSRQIDVAMSLLHVSSSAVVLMLIRPLHALACAHRMRTLPADDGATYLRELDSSLEWLRNRAQDATDLVPVRTLVEAERAWAIGDVSGASDIFEAALRADTTRTSPGQRAFLHERAGRFYCTRGLLRYGRSLLEDARRLYEQWGATAKARALDVEFALPKTSPRGERRVDNAKGTIVSSEAIDMIAILRASQALSSQTTIEQLTARVGELLAALTGATAVSLAIRRDDANDWVASPHGDGASISLDDARAPSAIPLSAFRYVQRTLEPLVLEDATRDDRFARDPYFAGRNGCSLLAVPISSQGALRAVVLLENSLGRGAFSTTGLDAVLLIAGQLAVSLDNALLYASLERKVADRTAALANANRQLERLSLTDALTGLANRRAFDERLATAWQNGLRAETQLGLIMIDIDEFKKYNDRYGHIAGDECLERVARTLASGVRPESDFVARYGGEEFVIVVRAGPHAVASTAERLRASVAALGIEHASSRAGIVTISLGVATFVPAASSESITFLEAADRALYTAKHDGRNRVGYADARV